jgi:hypothetical protein
MGTSNADWPWTVDRGPWTVDRGPWTLSDTPYPSDHGPGVVEHHGDHVDSARPWAQVVGGATEPVVLQVGHLGHWIDAHPALDLYRYHPSINADQQIDLATTCAEVTGDQPSTPALEEGESNRLAAGA